MCTQIKGAYEPTALDKVFAIQVPFRYDLEMRLGEIPGQSHVPRLLVLAGRATFWTIAQSG